jgi:hypothetical protein
MWAGRHAGWPAALGRLEQWACSSWACLKAVARRVSQVNPTSTAQPLALLFSLPCKGSRHQIQQRQLASPKWGSWLNPALHAAACFFWFWQAWRLLHLQARALKHAGCCCTADCG